MTASRVLGVAAVPPADAARHFARRLEYETDCSDVHADLAAAVPGFVVVDARAPDAFTAGHVPGARSLPHATIDAQTAAELPLGALVVTYCWGPHCNGATRAAARLAALGYQVKEMIGGIAGWQAEGYELETTQPKPHDALSEAKLPERRRVAPRAAPLTRSATKQY